MALHTYPGNIHIHSTYSDGSDSIKQIAAHAERAGLSYIIITDHETLAGIAEEGLHSNVVTLVGVEINRPHSHYLAFGLTETPVPDPENPQTVIDAVRSAGGLGFIAHPFEKGSRFIEKGKAYPWRYWPVFGFTGMEIWNYSSHWRGRHPSLLRTIYHFFLNRKGAMDSPPPEILQLWDCYNQSGHRVVGIGGSDAHAFSYRFGFILIKIFTYRYIFNTINTYVVLEEQLSSDFSKAKKQILGALAEGRCYVSFDSLAKGKDFIFYAASGEKRFFPGSAPILTQGLKLVANIPSRRSIFRLIQNGNVIQTYRGNRFEHPLKETGVYRVEIYYKPHFGRSRPWIFSNPIFINKGD